MLVTKQFYKWFTQRRPGLRSAMSLELCLLVGLFVAGCGVSLDPGQTGQTPGETPGNTPMQPPAQGVMLISDRSSYTPSSTITVTLTNRGSSSIFAPNHQNGMHHPYRATGNQ